MKKFFAVAASLWAQTAVFAQHPSPSASPNDVEILRQQVQALTETVKTLQQQVKAQQAALAKMTAELGNPADSSREHTHSLARRECDHVVSDE